MASHGKVECPEQAVGSPKADRLRVEGHPPFMAGHYEVYVLMDGSPSRVRFRGRLN